MMYILHIIYSLHSLLFYLGNDTNSRSMTKNYAKFFKVNFVEDKNNSIVNNLKAI